jgi:hypothetical protein
LYGFGDSKGFRLGIGLFECARCVSFLVRLKIPRGGTGNGIFPSGFTGKERRAREKRNRRSKMDQNKKTVKKKKKEVLEMKRLSR